MNAESMNTRGASKQRREKDDKKQEPIYGSWRSPLDKEKTMRQNGLFFSAMKVKKDERNTEKSYSEAKQTSKHKCKKSTNSSHISLTNQQDLEPKLRNTNTKPWSLSLWYLCWWKMNAPQGSWHVSTWLPTNCWCWKHDVYGHWLGDNDKRHGPWISPLWMSSCLKHCSVDGATDYLRSLQSPTDRANVWPVDGAIQMKLKPHDGSLRGPVAYDDEILKLFATALQPFSYACPSTISPLELKLSWASHGEALGMGCAYSGKKSGTVGPQMKGRLDVVVGAPTLYQDVEWSC